MGQRTRRQGVTGKALRAARSAAQARDEEAQAIAQNVYNIVRELKAAPDAEALPLHILAPLMAAAEQAAPGAARMGEMAITTPSLYLDVAAYLVAGFREMVVCFDPAHFEAWRARTDALDTSTEEVHIGNADSTGPEPRAADGGTAPGERRADGTS